MDHLYTPESCKPQALEVPYLGHPDVPRYDRLGFEGFPERFSINSGEIIASHSILPWRAELVESFLQEWLWFGLLHEFGRTCSVDINFSDFIKQSPSGRQQILTTQSLLVDYARRVIVKQLELEYFLMGLKLQKEQAARVQSQNGLRPSAEEATEDNRANYLGQTDCSEENLTLELLRERLASRRRLRRSMSNNWEPVTESIEPKGKRSDFARCIAKVGEVTITIMSQQDPVVRRDIVFSIDILRFSLAEIIWTVFRERIDVQCADDYLTYIEKNMINHSWCPSRAAILAGKYFLPSTYISSLLPSYQNISHRGCRPRKCLIRPLHIEHMGYQHRPDCARNCQTISVVESQLIDILRSGGIPGLRLVPGGQTGHEIVDCRGKKFVAISHVWSHGLGNPKRNALPFCQVRFLDSAVKRCAGNDVLLWIDTLSVPVEPQYKRIAIARLRDIYSGAYQVLVIDKGLMQVGDDRIEQMMQLLGSEWLRRLWTLQEGRLAQELLIQFRNKAISVGELAADLQWDAENSHFGIFDFYGNILEEIRDRFSRRTDLTVRFRDLVKDLGSRSVTVRSDEPICIATLLGLSLEDFNSQPTMVDIYRSLPTLPQDIIFQHQPRIGIPGLSWAPATFLESEFPAFQGQASGTLTQQGLYVLKD